MKQLSASPLSHAHCSLPKWYKGNNLFGQSNSYPPVRRQAWLKLGHCRHQVILNFVYEYEQLVRHFLASRRKLLTQCSRRNRHYPITVWKLNRTAFATEISSLVLRKNKEKALIPPLTFRRQAAIVPRRIKSCCHPDSSLQFRLQTQSPSTNRGLFLPWRMYSYVSRMCDEENSIEKCKNFLSPLLLPYSVCPLPFRPALVQFPHAFLPVHSIITTNESF